MKKKIYVLILACCIVMFIIVNRIIDRKIIEVYNDYTVVYGIESAETDVAEKKMVINGWCINLAGKDDDDRRIILRESESGKLIYMDTEMQDKGDIYDYYDIPKNGSKSGFSASVKIGKLVENTKYEILIKLDKGSQETFNTGYYIYNNSMYRANPDINVNGIGENGSFGKKNMVAAFHEYDVYIYQNGNKLIYLIGKDYNYSEGGTYIELMLRTTNAYKLPEGRQPYGFDNIGDYIEKYEVFDYDVPQYRVFVRTLPEEYPITYITTGVHIEKSGWLWGSDIMVQTDINSK